MDHLINKIPTKEEAIALLKEAELRNPGPWVDHSYYVAQAAKLIADQVNSLDSNKAYVLGLLHDIGRRQGIHGMKHSIDGYDFAVDKGYDSVARICLTHIAFKYQENTVIVGTWDGTESQRQKVLEYVNSITENDYDRLIKLCDYISLSTGYCLLEKRIVEMTMRSGFNELTIPRWQSTFEIKKYFEEKIGRSIYQILPNVVENTFN